MKKESIGMVAHNEYHVEKGVEASTSYSYFYYKNGKMMMRCEFYEGKIWNVTNYFKPNGEPFNEYGDFKDGIGSLVFIYLTKRRGSMHKFRYYITPKGKQKRKIVKSDWLWLLIKMKNVSQQLRLNEEGGTTEFGLSYHMISKAV